MSRINVLVAVTSRDVKAAVLCDAIATRPDMDLVRPGVVLAADVDALLPSLPSAERCVVVLVSRASEVDERVERWLAARADLAVLHVDLIGDLVRIVLRDPSLHTLLTALRGLVERMGREPRERLSHIRIWAGTQAGAIDVHSDEEPPRPLLHAAFTWVHEVLRDAVASVPDEVGDLRGLSVTRAALLRSLDGDVERDPEDRSQELAEADEALADALIAADEGTEALALAHRVFELGPLEFRMLVLALAPELDQRHQRCIGFLLDEMGRRMGTTALYTSLLGTPARVRRELGDSGVLSKWAVFEGVGGRPAAGDEPLRLDPFLVQWLLGERSALTADPRVRRLLRLDAWPGTDLLAEQGEQETAARLLHKLRGPDAPQWVVLAGPDSAGWRALADLAVRAEKVPPLRVDPKALAGVDALEVEECGLRIARAARLTGAPLVVDLARADETEDDDRLRLLLATLTKAECHAAVICVDAARVIGLLGSASVETLNDGAMTSTARVGAVQVAARWAGAPLTSQSAAVVAGQYPLRVDGLEQAARLALQQPLDLDADDPSLARFVAACRRVASEGVSRLAERIEPLFDLDDVVLPTDRKEQLVEIVDNVRHAARVLDVWKFRDRLPYGRGVSALFFGASGTGKTMAAMAIARALGVQMLRLDLSRVVSKYIGDTEKNIDRVFTDAQESGAAVLIDEADALLGKRSEVKDAHDRYANIEVAYLLQRMEAYEGLAILTTNLRQNLDPAFLRRLRFIVDFPRPDADAREQIWRHCLPPDSHELDAAAFRLLARRVDLTGGHIRQITLRAAFIAAAAEKLITLEHIAHATRGELAKLGMPPIELAADERRRAA